MSESGRVVAVCVGEEGELWKHSVSEVVVGQHGLLGDRHATPTRRSFKDPSVIKPNDRQVTLVAAEVLEHLAGELGIELVHGSFGENLTVSGMGDLSQIPDGTLLRIGGRVVLRVTGQNKPCHNLQQHHPLLTKEAYGRRGLLTTVVSGVGEILRSGDRIEILPAV